jgi:D-glycero-D-manno-heptose 1,7-bisphosphate phosphatase
MVKVAFLDRDGVLNRDRPDYIKNEGELEVFPFAREAVATLREAGWRVYIVSNQSVVGRGLSSLADVEAMTAKLVRLAGPVDGIFYCYHKPEDGCSCRKPKPGLLLRGLEEAAAEGPLEECWMIGDSGRDVEAGVRAGCRTAVVLSGRLSDEEARELEPPPDAVVADVLEAARLLVGLGP